MESRKRKNHQDKNLNPLHTLTYFEIQKYYKNEHKFNGVYSRDNLPDKIKDGEYVINFDEFLILKLTGLLCMQ